MKKLKISIISGSRAEYGILYWIIKELNTVKNFKINFIVSGSHLSKNFGYTIKQIKKDKIEVNEKVFINVEKDTILDINKSISEGIIAFTKVFIKNKPDLIMLVGDRFETFSAAISAYTLRIPIAHIHGGEITEGAYDEGFRHSITKMSHIHFASNKIHKKRIIQLGENSKNVYVVGAPGIDNIYRLKLYNKISLEKKLKIKFANRNLLITLHSETLNTEKNISNINNLIGAINSLDNTNIFFTLANPDVGGNIINKIINKYVLQNREKSYVFKSLGQKNYLSLLKYVDVVIGNSSSGIIEVPSFKKASINLGNRQSGRLQAKSIINCDNQKKDILKAINRVYSKNFQKKLKNIVNPYGDGNASKKIVKILKEKNMKDIIIKKFYDL